MLVARLDILEEHRSFGGTVGYYRHQSPATNCDMAFAAFVPDGAKGAASITFLAGLTCTHETFMIKAGARRLAAELGLVLIAPDTSPRGPGVPDDPEGGWDFGLGAGFYLDATRVPWRRHYRMASYILDDLQQAVLENFPVDPDRRGLMGHSMGGHGALTLGLKDPEIFRSLSAFAPISNPCQCPWGEKAFTHYLGEDREAWKAYDASEIIRGLKDGKKRTPILVDQGSEDPFLEEQLKTDTLSEAAKKAGLKLKLRVQKGYDHSYFFIESFIDDHLRHHAEILGGK